MVVLVHGGMGGRAAARRHDRRDAVRLTRRRDVALTRPGGHPGLLHPDCQLVYLAVSLFRFEAKYVLAVQFLGHPRKRGPELARLLQLEVATARFVGEFAERAVRLAAHHSRAVEELAFEADGVDHHFLGARPLQHRVSPGLAGGVVTVGEYEDDAAPL